MAGGPHEPNRCHGEARSDIPRVWIRVDAPQGLGHVTPTQTYPVGAAPEGLHLQDNPDWPTHGPPRISTAGGRCNSRSPGLTGCRVGITTNLFERRAHWEGKYPAMKEWQERGPYPTKTEAQKAENRFADVLGCASAPGGTGPEVATWWLYYFEY